MYSEKHDESSVEEENVGSGMKKPFDPNRIRVREVPMTIDSVIKRIEHKEINLDTAFQRKGELWTDEQQSRLIESILIRFPLPVFYFDGRNPNDWSVIDGLQRLTSFKRFVLDRDLRLRGLEFLSDLNGKTWDELSRPKQRQIIESILQCYIIEEGQEEVVFNIFKRINKG